MARRHIVVLELTQHDERGEAHPEEWKFAAMLSANAAYLSSVDVTDIEYEAVNVEVR